MGLSKEDFDTIVLDELDDFVGIIDEDGNVLYANNPCATLTGYSIDQLLKMDVFDFVPKSHHKEVRRFMKVIFKSKKGPLYHEQLVYNAEKQPIWLAQTLKFIEVNGQTLLMSINRNLSDRKSAHNIIHNNSRRLKALFGSTEEALLLEDENSKLFLANQQFLKFFNIHQEMEELLGQDTLELKKLISQQFTSSNKVLQRFQTFEENHEFVPHETWPLKDGRILQINYSPILEEDTFLGHSWRFFDVSEGFKTREERNRFFEMSSDLICTLAINGNLSEVNPSFTKLLGFSKEELLEKSLMDLMHPDDIIEPMKEFTRMSNGVPNVWFEARFRCKDGDFKWLAWRASMDPENNTIYAIGRDIGDQRKFREELETAKREAEQAQESEKQFLTHMSHEIRTPLNAVIGLTHLLYDTDLSPKQIEYLDSLKYSSDLLMSIIKDLLDLNKIEMGELELFKGEFDLEGVLSGIAKTFKYKCKEKEIDFKFISDSNLPREVIADKRSFEQILNNLLDNAVKFTNSGSVTLDIQMVEKSKEFATLLFSISDTGIGIPENMYDKIFEKFKQGSSKIGLRYGGSGIGLTICKELAERINGKITVDSKLGEGSTFEFLIPFELPQPVSELGENDGAEKEPTKIKRDYSILVVEDNLINQQYVANLLKKWNYSYSIAGNGKEALFFLDKNKYDLILMDIRMPVLDGYEASKALRANTNNPNCNIPIIALTASALSNDREKALSIGMNEHLTKPFSPIGLKDLIEKYIGRQKKNDPEMEEKKTDSSTYEIDHKYLYEMYDGDTSFMKELFGIFLENLPSNVVKVREAHAKKDMKMLFEQVHKIKPSFAMVGLQGIEHILLGIEETCQGQRDLADLDGLMEEFFVHLEQGIKSVEAQIQKME